MRLMIDSGAFSVWSKGKTVDLDAYIAFCRKCEQVKHFVNLDVIPDARNPPDKAAELSWRNYQRMREELPNKSIIPVFHQDDPMKWIGRYLEAGVKYLGVSPYSDRTTANRLTWLRSLKPLLVNKDRTPRVKMHSFGAASYAIMASFPWFSVDSTTWAKHANVWNILIPRFRGGRFVYDSDPSPVNLSPRRVGKQQSHIDTQTPVLRDLTTRFLREEGITLGKYDLVEVKTGYKRQIGEYWLDHKKTAVVRTVEPGVRTDPNLRLLLNARVYQRMAEQAGVKRFYLSGFPGNVPWLSEVKNVLVAFGNIPRGFEQWL